MRSKLRLVIPWANDNQIFKTSASLLGTLNSVQLSPTPYPLLFLSLEKHFLAGRNLFLSHHRLHQRRRRLYDPLIRALLIRSRLESSSSQLVPLHRRCCHLHSYSFQFKWFWGKESLFFACCCCSSRCRAGMAFERGWIPLRLFLLS